MVNFVMIYFTIKILSEKKKKKNNSKAKGLKRLQSTELFTPCNLKKVIELRAHSGLIHSYPSLLIDRPVPADYN